MTTFSDQTLDLGRIRAIPKALTLPEPVEPASAPVAPVESSAADTLDTYIRQNRAVTPRSVTEMRKVPRASIEEINDTDFEELRSRMLALGDRDTRSPAMKFLDLIDAPRNVIMSVLNSDLRKKAEAEGNTGTFGLGRVQFSDLLRSAGVNNRVAAGVLGFVGDVAFDPLTYIGPAGWGAKIGTTTKAGRAVSVGLRRTGKTALDRQIARLAAGGAEVVDEAAHGYLTAKAAQKGFTSPQEWISTLAGQGKDAKGIRNEIARVVYGDPSKSALERVFRPLGGERTMERAAPAADDVGNFAYDFFRSDSATDAAGMAARKFVEKYGEGTGKALRFGKAKGGVGSQILHVPFLDQYTVQVSPFTAGAVRALDNARLAMRAGDAVSSAPGEVGRPFLSLADELVNDEQELVTISEAKVQAAADHAAARMSYPDDLPEMPPDPDLPPSTDPVPPPGPTPIVPGGLEIPPDAPARTSNYIVGDFVQPQPVKPVQDQIDFDVEGRAQEILDAGDAVEMDEALDMARMEQAALERQAAESAGAGVPPSTIGTTQEAGNVLEEGRQEGREGLLSPGSATTTPPAVDEAAGALPRTQRERVLGELRVAFSNVPPEQQEEWAKLVDARAQTWAREGKGRTPDQFWEQLRVEKGKAGEGQLYQSALHGSPHRFGIDESGKVLDPKAFSLSAIGSGEGAQAYTRGLYFTQSDDVQRHYRNLGSRGRYLLNNTLVDDKTIAQRVLNLAESYMSSTDAVDIQRRVSSALQRGGAASAIEQAESAYIGKYFNDWDAAARESNPALYQLAKERHGWDASGLSDLAADVKSSPLASTGDKEIDEAIRATLPEYKPDPDSDAVVHMLRGLEDPPRETRVELRPRDGVRAMRSMSESDKSSLFEIESRMHWAHGTTPAEKLESVKGDLRRTVEVQSDWKARYEREWSDRFGGTPRLLTQAETNKIVDDIEKAILDTLGSSDELADDLGKVQRDLSYWNEVDGYVNGNLLADGTIRTQAIEDMLKRHLGASDAAKVIASEAWSAVESGLSRPSAYHYWDEAASSMKKAQSALDVADKYDIQAVKLVKPGATYKVELAPTDEDLVWWDKPISENPAKVQQAVLDMYPIDPNNWEEGKMGAADGRHFLRWDGPGGVGVVGIVSPELNGMWAAHSGTQMPNANNLIDYFSSLDDAKAAVAAQAHKAVDEYLSKTKAGSWLKTLERDRGVMAPPTELLKRDVRGVKYLDGMSRADGHGSYNFVIYDDKDVTITEALLQRKGKSPLASLSFEQDGKAVMRALKSPNITSLVHEASHLFLPGLADQDLNVVARVYGVTPELLRVRSEQLSVAERTRWVRAHEHFARDFEKYTATGKAPTKELESVFAKLKDWFVAIYKKIIGTPLEREIDPRIRGVFDRMLGAENVGPEITDVGITSKGWVAKQLDDMLAPYRDMNAQMHDLQVMRGVDEQLGEDINGMMVTSDSAADLANAVYHHPDAPPGGTNLQAWMKSHKSEKAMRSLRRFVPGEIMAAIDGRPDLAKYIKLVPEAGGKRGGEFANLDTDVIVENLERLAGGEARERRRALELAGNNDPRLRFYADIYETWPTDQVERQVIRRRVYRDPKTGKTVLNERGNKVMESHRGTVIEQVAREQPTEMVDAGTIPPGSVFTINGRQHVVIESEDGGGMIRYEGPDGSQRHIPGNIGEIPVDRGSIRAATEDELDSLIPDDAEFDPASELYQRDVSGQGGLFGSRVGRISSGEQQGGLFGSAPEVPAPKTEIPTGDPERMLGESDAAYRERVALHRKWAESAKNTSTLFQDDLDGGQPNLIPTKTPRQIFDEQHAAAMEAMDKQYRETLGRIAEKRDRIVKELEAFDPKTAAPTVATLNDLLKLGEMRDNADSLLQLEMRRARTAKMAQAIDAADDPVFRSQEVGERLYNLVRNDPKAASDYADAITARMEALNAYRETIKATLSDIADADELEVASLAKSLLGTDDASIALSVFAAPARFLRDKFGENSAAFQYAEAMDRFWRRTFGVRRGTTTQLLTDISADMTARPISERMHAMSRMVDRVEAMKLPLEQADAMNLLHAYVYKHLGDTVLNGGAFAWKIGPDGQNLGDSEMVQLLKRAQDAGALTPANIQALKQAAAEHVDEMKRLGFSEQDYGVLGLLRPDYVYSPATKDAQQAMRLHAEAGSANPNVARAGPAFARARTLDQVRFPIQNPDDLLAPAEAETRWHRFFVGDMALADVPDDMLRPEQLTAKAAVVDYLKRVEEDPEFAAKFPPRPSDPMEINELAAQGRFQHVTGGAPIDKMKETDLSVVYGLRMGQHQHAMGMARLGEFLQRESFQIDPALFDQWERSPGKVLRLRGGTSARVVTNLKSNLDRAVSGVRIGDTVYRRLDSSLWSTGNNVLGNLFARMADGRGSKTPITLEHLLVHHAVADKIEDMLRMGEPKRFEELLHTADTLTGMWKQLTLMHPAWVVFNIVGDTANALAGGADPRTLVDAQRGRELMDVYRYRHNPEKLADIVVGLRDGREMTGTEFWNAVTNSRVVDNTLSSEAMLKIVEDNPGLLDAADRTMRKYTAPWFRANQSLQDWMRMMVFSSFLDQGVDTPIAAKRVLESIGDYSDFTKVEERFFRRVFPFYSWMRNNLGYQIMQLGQRPGYAALMPKLHTALEEATAGEAAVPENMRPGWMRDQLATQIGADPKSRISLMLGSALPSGDIASVAQGMFGREGAMKFLHYFTSNINPVITVPLQLGTGTEFFSGRSIGPDAYSGDTSVTDFAISQASGPLSEFGSKLPAAFSRSTEEGVARLAMRGRVQAFDEQRLSSGVRREFREQEQRIRSAVYRAQRDGDAELSAEARARLMQLYVDALRRGMEDVVPDWAERQLAELTSRAG